MLLTYQQAAEELNVSKRHFERLVGTGDIPTVKVGKRSRRIEPEDLAIFITENKQCLSTSEAQSGGASSKQAGTNTADPLGQPRSARRKRSSANLGKKLPNTCTQTEPASRSEERRGGKECRSRRSTCH